jgi:drug/metabolite transporter (DMT)-like permease
MTTAWLALASAFLWGGGDFSGGMGVKAAGGRLPGALRVVLLSHATSLSVLLVILACRHDPFPHPTALAWGIFAGLSGGSGVVMFYIALSRGSMGASAAISGLLAAAIPSVLAIWIDGPPSLEKLLGFLLAGAAIWLIAGASGHEARGTMGLAILSGAGFGVYFVALRFAGVQGIFWPLANSRMASLTLCATMLFLLRLRGPAEPHTMGRTAIAWTFGTALLDTGGNLFFIAATRAGRLDVAAVLASLYPATTILLAALALKEAPTRRQGIGMALAAAAVLLITL